MLLMFIVLLLTTDPAPAETAPPPVTTTAKVHVFVTDRDGTPLPSAHVVVRGASEREGQTDTAGRVTFENVRQGEYALTVDRTEFITLQKDFTVESSRESMAVSAALSRAKAGAARRR
jgi:Carboxypeptidase regulatory-like domain